MYTSNGSQLPLQQFAHPMKQFTGSIIFSEKQNQATPSTSTPTNAALTQIIQRNRFPILNSVLGAYEEITEDFFTAFNHCISERQHLLSLNAEVITDAIIQTPNAYLIITTCELYSHDTNIDEHLHANS